MGKLSLGQTPASQSAIRRTAGAVARERPAVSEQASAAALILRLRPAPTTAAGLDARPSVGPAAFSTVSTSVPSAAAMGERQGAPVTSGHRPPATLASVTRSTRRFQQHDREDGMGSCDSLAHSSPRAGCCLRGGRRRPSREVTQWTCLGCLAACRTGGPRRVVERS